MPPIPLRTRPPHKKSRVEGENIMQSIFSPGIALTCCLKYADKFGLISVFFVVSMAMLVQQAASIEVRNGVAA